MEKISIELPGILLLPLAPYPKEGGRYRVIFPPLAISGMPTCQPGISRFSSKLMLLASSKT